MKKLPPGCPNKVLSQTPETPLEMPKPFLLQRKCWLEFCFPIQHCWIGLRNSDSRTPTQHLAVRPLWQNVNSGAAVQMAPFLIGIALIKVTHGHHIKLTNFLRTNKKAAAPWLLLQAKWGKYCGISVYLVLCNINVVWTSFACRLNLPASDNILEANVFELLCFAQA